MTKLPDEMQLYNEAEETFERCWPPSLDRPSTDVKTQIVMLMAGFALAQLRKGRDGI